MKISRGKVERLKSTTVKVGRSTNPVSETSVGTEEKEFVGCKEDSPLEPRGSFICVLGCETVPKERKWRRGGPNKSSSVSLGIQSSTISGRVLGRYRGGKTSHTFSFKILPETLGCTRR